ncbi:MAG: hypothetical protein N0A15_01690 [Anaerolineae bacterium]|nr:hypothetical protein [Anaerolineae bacterium]
MAFTVQDYFDLVRLLAEHPEWRAELRRLVLSDEVLTLPELVRELAEIQRRTEERLEVLAQHVDALIETQRRTEERVNALAEAQQRTEERLAALAQHIDELTQRLNTLTQRVDELTQRLNALTQRVDELTQRVDALTQRVDELTQRLNTLTQRVDELTQRLNALTQRVDELTQRVDALTQRVDVLTQRVDALAEAQRRTEQQLEALATTVNNLTLEVTELTHTQKRIIDRLAKLEGRMLEWEYREKAPAFFGSLLRKTRLARREELADQVEDRLPLNEFRDVLLADLFVQGQPRALPQAGNVLLVVEVSSVVDEGDVTRAGRRASLLRQAGLRTVPVVAGESITESGDLEARRQNVVIIQDGEHLRWDEALIAWVQ